MSELDDIQRRADSQPAYSFPHEAQQDRDTLLTLVRAQQATLTRVLNLANASGRCGWRISADELRRTLRGES